MIDSKLVFTLKFKADAAVDKRKARLVAKGFQEGHVEDVYAPVVDFATVRLTLAIMGCQGALIHQMDVKSAFLNGKFHDDDSVYLNPPNGLDLGVKHTQALKMLKALYGFKRSPKIWNNTWNKSTKRLGFGRLKADEWFYFIKIDGSTVWVLVYVDDVLVIGSCIKAVKAAKLMLSQEFEMKDLGVAKSFLGVEFLYNSEGVALRQKYYIEQVLEKFAMSQCKPVKTPLCAPTMQEAGFEILHDPGIKRFREAIGALLYVSTRTRPDIAAAVGILSRKCQNPSQQDWANVKRIMRYLKGTSSMSLQFSGKNESLLPLVESYSDADWAGDVSDRKSTSGIVIFFNRTPVVWKSRKQTGVSLSSTESEYVALSERVKQTNWIRMVLFELNMLPSDPTVIFENNLGALRWSSGEKRAKHVDIRFHFVADEVEKGTVQIQYCPTHEMIANALTKGLTTHRLEYLRELLCIRNIKEQSH